jgi:hypothetical protein
MINKIDIVNNRLTSLHELRSDIEMNLQLNNSLEFPIQENEDELHRCLVDTDNKIAALEELLASLDA